jgi:hypothetical protein
MQRPCHCLNFNLKWTYWNFVHGRRTTGKGRQPRRFRASGSRQCAPDDRLRTPSDLIREWAAVRVMKTRQTRVHLQQRKCDAETYDQRCGADRHDGKSPFGMLFDIRVHVDLRGKAGFVPQATRRTQTLSGTGADSASTSPRLAASPRARSTDIRRPVSLRVSRSQSCTSRTSGTEVAAALLTCARDDGRALVTISVVTRLTGRHANCGAEPDLMPHSRFGMRTAQALVLGRRRISHGDHPHFTLGTARPFDFRCHEGNGNELGLRHWSSSWMAYGG